MGLKLWLCLYIVVYNYNYDGFQVELCMYIRVYASLMSDIACACSLYTLFVAIQSPYVRGKNEAKVYKKQFVPLYLFGE